MASSRKRSVTDGINALAFGTVLTTGGVAAGAQVAVEAASRLQALEESPDQLDWDDAEEQNYRQWLRQLQDARAQQGPADWSELEDEAAYRERLRQQTLASGDVQIQWDDDQERIWRQRYVQMRKEKRDQPASWDEQKAEEEHRERIRQRQEANRKKAVVWDDAEERKCQERYRKKYSCN